MMNKAKQEEQGLMGSALETMRRSNITVYKHAGIELVRVPGAEKLRVRVVKDQGDATVETGAESAENAGEGQGEYDADSAHEAE